MEAIFEIFIFIGITVFCFGLFAAESNPILAVVCVLVGGCICLGIQEVYRWKDSNERN